MDGLKLCILSLYFLSLFFSLFSLCFLFKIYLLYLASEEYTALFDALTKNPSVKHLYLSCYNTAHPNCECLEVSKFYANRFFYFRDTRTRYIYLVKLTEI